MQQPHMLGGSLDNGGAIEGAYTAGQEFFLEFVLSTHHRGHFEVFLCDISDGSELTAGCLQAQVGSAGCQPCLVPRTCGA